MDRVLWNWTLAISLGLTLASAVSAEEPEVTQINGAWQAVACVDAEVLQASRVAELKAQAAMVREREAHRLYGHEAIAPDVFGGDSLRVASYSSGRMQPIRTAIWAEYDAGAGRELSCVRIMEASHRG